MSVMTMDEANSFSTIWAEFLLETDEISLDGLSEDEIKGIEYLFNEKGYLVARYIYTLGVQIEAPSKSVRAGILSILSLLLMRSLVTGSLLVGLGGIGIVWYGLLFLLVYVFVKSYLNLMTFTRMKYKYEKKMKHVLQRYEELETLLFARRTTIAISQAMEDVQ